ncbi:MAG: phage holin family protein [Candidatus Buchananbacteria bacterium]|nr:phage holin family protein [Candidatus Buchananbacteria bacterium]
MAIIIGLFSNILALYLANLWVSGFSVIDGWKAYLIAGIALGMLNLIIRPILKIITFPLITVSLGLFLIVINAIMLWLTAQLTGYIVIESYVALLWATLIVATVNFITKWFK